MKLPNQVTLRALTLTLILWPILWWLSLQPAVRDWDRVGTDWVMRQQGPKTAADPKVILISIDQKSLNWAKETQGLGWPWPREMYAYLLNFCHQAQTGPIALDILFTEPSIYGNHDDQALAEAIAKAQAILPMLLVDGDTVEWPADLTSPSYRISGCNQQAAKSPLPPTEAIATAVKFWCAINQKPDSDGIFRTLSPGNHVDDSFLPTLGLALYLQNRPNLKQVAQQDHQLQIGTQTFPLNEQGKLVLNYRGPGQTFNHISAADLLYAIGLAEHDPRRLAIVQQLQGAYLILGFTAPGLHDQHESPFPGKMSGPEIHATLLDNLLKGDFLRPLPAITFGLYLFLLIFSGSLMGFTIKQKRHLLLYSAPIACTILGPHVFYHHQWLVPLFSPTLALLITWMVTGFIQFFTEGNQRRQIKHAFGHYLSPAVIEELLADPTQLKLGGSRRELTILFADIADFTGLSEQLDAELLVDVLNRCFDRLTEVIIAYGGTIDKYEGDALIAFWNAPTETAGHPQKAFEAAKTCLQELEAMNPELEPLCGRALSLRIGLHCGDAIVGNMGSKARFNYTMIGDAVNLASRLEGANKFFRTKLLISETVASQLSDQTQIKPLGKIQVKGRKHPIAVYSGEMAEKAYLAAFAQYQAGDYKLALAAFEALPPDPLNARFIDWLKNKCKKDVIWPDFWVLSEK